MIGRRHDTQGDATAVGQHGAGQGRAGEDRAGAQIELKTRRAVSCSASVHVTRVGTGQQEDIYYVSPHSGCTAQVGQDKQP